MEDAQHVCSVLPGEYAPAVQEFFLACDSRRIHGLWNRLVLREKF